MLISCVNGLFVDSLAFMSNKDKTVPARLDTGAFASFVTTGALRELVPDYVEYLKQYSTETRKVKAANGAVFSATEIILRNVTLCSFGIHDFRCLLQDNDYVMCLLGMDFITACRATLDYDELRLTEFSESVYADNIQKYHKGDTVEVNTVSEFSSTSKSLNAYFTKMGIFGAEEQRAEVRRLEKLYNTSYLVEIVSYVYRDFM